MRNQMKVYRNQKQSKRNKLNPKKRKQERKVGERSVLQKYTLQDVHSDEGYSVLHILLVLQKKAFLLTCKYKRNCREKDIIFHICCDLNYPC